MDERYGEDVEAAPPSRFVTTAAGFDPQTTPFPRAGVATVAAPRGSAVSPRPSAT